MSSDDNPQMRTIRMLENKLDKAMIKYNEAQSIRKTYEMIVKRLKDERVGYDNQLAAIEQSLKGKQHDFEELLLLSYDAKHAKEVAEAELRKFEAQLQAKRELRDKEIAEQQKTVKQRVENKNLNEEKNKETHKLEILSKKKEYEEARKQKVDSHQVDQNAVDKKKSQIEKYDESLRKIKDATGASDINEIIQRCVTQKDMYLSRYNSAGGQISALENLKSERVDYERRILELDEEKLNYKQLLQRVKFEGVESITRKQINELEKNVSEAQTRFEKNKDRLERIVKKLVDSKAGVEHLSDKLIDIKVEDDNNFDAGDDTVERRDINSFGMKSNLSKDKTNVSSTLVETLKQIEKKCSRITNEVQKDELYDDIMSRIRGLRVDKDSETPLYQKLEYDVPSLEQIKNNVRVRIPEKEEDDLSDIDPDAEAEAETNERMKIKVEAQLRYDRMEKNKTRKAKKTGKNY